VRGVKQDALIPEAMVRLKLFESHKPYRDEALID